MDFFGPTITTVAPLDIILIGQQSSGLVKRITLQDLVTSIVAQTKNQLVVTYLNTDTVLDSSMGYVVVNSAGPVTLTLPLANINSGVQLPIENKGSGVVTIQASGADSISGASTITLAQYDKRVPLSDGINLWSV
jgi:hypothetical protein